MNSATATKSLVTQAETSRHNEPGHKITMSGKRLASNYLLLVFGESFSKILTFAAFAYLGRSLGPEKYGQVEFVLSIMVFFTLPVDFGLGMYGARELAGGRAHAPTLLRQVSTLRLLQATISYSVLCVVAWLLSAHADAKALLLVIGVSLFFEPILLQWFFQGHDQMRLVAMINLLRRGVFAILVLLVMNNGVPLFWVGISECIAAAAAGLFGLIALRRRWGLGIPIPWLRAGDLFTHFRCYAAIGLNEIAWAFLWYCTPVLMGILATGAEMGWFGASHRIVMAAHTFVWLYFFNLLPSLTRSFAQPRAELNRLLHRSLEITTWCGIGIGILTTFVAGDLMKVVYGDQFAGAAQTLAVLIWVIPTALVSGHYRFTLIAYRLQRFELLSAVISALTALGLSAILIPKYGGVGAATALLCSNIVNLAVSFTAVYRFIGWVPFHHQTIAPVLSACLSWFGYMALANWHTHVAQIVGCSIYALAFAVWLRCHCSFLRSKSSFHPA